MVHPSDCPSWEYRDFPSSDALLLERTKGLILDLRRGRLDSLESTVDTKSRHAFLFESLTPAGYEYYAGNYRGSEWRCLESYEVCIPGDPNVGYPPGLVLYSMSALGDTLRRGVNALDVAYVLPESQLEAHMKLYYTVVLASRAFVEFLTIHPYANGNGHMARLVVWAILGRFGYWPNCWPIEPRPDDPEYCNAIRSYRDRDYPALEKYILRCIISEPGVSSTVTV